MLVRPMNRAASGACGRALRAVIAAAAAGAMIAGSGCDGDGYPHSPISVHTRNLFFGGNFNDLLPVQTPAEIPAAVGQIWTTVQNSRFPERAGVIADQILAEEPDVVALQEVSWFRMQMPGDWTSGSPPNATENALDFLEILLAALRDRGGQYRTV